MIGIRFVICLTLGRLFFFYYYFNHFKRLIPRRAERMPIPSFVESAATIAQAAVLYIIVGTYIYIRLSAFYTIYLYITYTMNK